MEQDPVVIVGSACRFPGQASSTSRLWDLLRNPRDVLSEFPAGRLRLTNFYATQGEKHGSTDVKNKSYLLSEDPNLFDASFFNVNPLEANGMDPQQRLMLETVYEAVENAGQKLDVFQGSSTSVFLGVMNADYYDIQLRDPETMPRYNATGTARSILSNRISYFFDLKGPSMTIDTACSSSLVALHQAVLSIRNQECDAAVVAGANLLLDPSMYIAESKLHMLSVDSRSRMWDQAANGYARGEGFAALIIKRLSRAIKDGDSIDCIVRGSGVNSDGRTTGITMPSSAAQTDLIRQTYRQAGLDPVTNRPQFVECHGTGTAAGDPVEARALKDAFFPSSTHNDGAKLYVGSIKTVIGHLEGCAGLAGVLRAMLAMKNKTIPANLHFDTLNPAIEPYYGNLRVATASMPWPIAEGTIRASVNSFGFGGTNAHVILELPESPSMVPSEHHGTEWDDTFIGPFTFSANSQTSLLKTVEDHLQYLESNCAVDLRDLSCTLQTKRTTFPFRTFFSGATKQALMDYMRSTIDNAKDVATVEVGTHVLPSPSEDGPCILGIFTGQGAQWASMGRALIELSPVFRRAIENCEIALASLPEPPEWSLMREILATENRSRISEAAFSQPLCTALQIALVDLCWAAGLRFGAVVGHSSGEIAAVYAAGLLSAQDAIRIAYFRGLYAQYACGTEAQSGAMIAVGMSFEHAQLFCSDQRFLGRLSVAASNSPSSVTLSGDFDAVTEAKLIFDERKVFARVLKVDTAYHSHHMMPCAEHYLKSMVECDIRIREPFPDCVWISSVRGDADLFEENDLGSLSGQYWVDNMTQTVLFSQAVECALWTAGPFDMVIEIGPHPALKGPTVQTIKSTLSEPLPYVGLLRRGTNEVEAFSGAIGYIWSHLAEDVVDFGGYKGAFSSTKNHPSAVSKDLPSYHWNHEKTFWRESRISKQFRLRDSPPQELLGRRSPDDSDYEPRWRNVLKLNEIPWLKGHEFQGQTLYPATGYISMALESTRSLHPGQSVRNIVIEDFKILQAVVVPDNAVGIETVFTLRDGATEHPFHKPEERKTYHFFSYACMDENRPLVQTSTGKITITFDNGLCQSLAPRQEGRAALSPIDTHQFYERLSKLGLNYHGLFRPEIEFSRCLNYATGSAQWNHGELSSDYVIHPALMDVSLHSIFAAFASPISEALWTTYLPVSISRMIIDLSISFGDDSSDMILEMDSYLTQTSARSIKGNIHVYDRERRPAILIEQLRVQAFEEAKKSNDRHLFSRTVWDIDIAEGFSSLESGQAYQFSCPQLGQVMERTSFFYLKSVFGVDPEHRTSVAGQFEHLQNTYMHNLRLLLNGMSSFGDKTWLEDTYEFIHKLRLAYDGNVDLDMMHRIGNSLPGILSGEVQLIELVTRDQLLDQFYETGRIFVPLNNYLAVCAKAISHKYPSMKVLEIGGGTGATTKTILDQIGDRFSSYTFTDISKGFFTQAQQNFAEYGQKLSFQSLDISKDIESQGFQRESYDVVIASNVLHATANLQQTMMNVRSLLKPGGFLLMVEVTGQTLQLSYVMGGFSAWWLGISEGRVHNPGISPTKWENLLQDTGFSGIETILHDMEDPSQHSCSAIITRASDTEYEIAQVPSSFPESATLGKELFVVGTSSLTTTQLSREIVRSSKRLFGISTVIKDLDAFEPDPGPNSAIVMLTELDKPLLAEEIDEARLRKLQKVLSSGASILWLTLGRLTGCPAANMVVGLARTLKYEIGDVHIQFLDFSDRRSINSSTVLCKLAQLCHSRARDPTLPVAWTIEPEMAHNGVSWQIPRVKAFNELNEIYNAGRRNISSADAFSSKTFELVEDTQGQNLLQIQRVQSSKHANASNFEVHCATMLGYSPTERHALCIGTVDGSSKVAIARSTSMRSQLSVTEEDLCILPVTTTEYDASSMLLAISSGLQASAIWNVAPARGIFAVFDATQALCLALVVNPARRGRTFCVVRTDEKLLDYSNFESTVHLATNDSTLSIRQKLPSSVSLLVFCDQPTDSLVSVMPNISLSSYLPIFLGSVYAWQDTILGLYNTIPADFEGFKNQAEKHTISLEKACQSIDRPRNMLDIIDWRIRHGLLAQVSPILDDGLFSSNKTYMLVGLNSELGLSIARWMITAGARNLVITSRRGLLDEKWEKEVSALGAKVIAYKMDVANKSSLSACRSLIEQTMPPIAGVCNGAMVLSDKLFKHMHAEDINNVLRPKVQGSMNLDEVFADVELDFFILFSSLASVVGNGGQANYHAANMFMTGLAHDRRRRGKSASVIHIGLVCDVGYVARTGQALIDHLLNLFYSPLTESDIHQLFAQAVIASPADSDRCPDIGMGLEPIHSDPTALRQPPWWNDPIFSHLRLEYSTQDETKLGKIAGESIKSKLSGTACFDDAVTVLTEVFLEKLEAILHLSAGAANKNVPLLDLGADSLLAVEIRQWFMSEIAVDVPVLKVLGGDSATDLCQHALRKYDFAHPAADPTTDSAEYEAHRMETSATAKDTSLTPPTQTDGSTPNLGSARSSSPEARSISTQPTTVEDIQSAIDFRPKLDRIGPLSFAQTRLWYQDKLFESPSSLNIAVRFDVEGSINANKLREALRTVVARHETLRSCFYQNENTGYPCQGTLLELPDRFSSVDVNKEAEFAVEMQKLKLHDWHLESGNTFDLKLMSTSKGQQCLLIGYHHIVLDGVSWGSLLSELDLAYRSQDLGPLVQQPIDIQDKEQVRLRDGAYENYLAFWERHLSQTCEPIPLLPFAKVKTRCPVSRLKNATASIQLSQQTLNSVRGVSRKLKVTPFHIHLTTLQLLLQHLTGREDMCIGITDSNRQDSYLDGAIGFFLNLLPLQFDLSNSPSVAELAARTKLVAFQAQKNAAVPLEKILDRLQVPRSSDHSPLFQVVMNYRLGEMVNIPIGSARLRLQDSIEAQSPFDLVLNITDSTDGQCYLQVTTNSVLYENDTASFLCKAYESMLTTIIHDTDAPSAQILSSVDHSQLSHVAMREDDYKSLNLSSSLVSAIKTLSDAQPDATAISFNGCKYTYSDIRTTASSIARTLNSLGLNHGSRVVVCQEPSVKMVGSLLAVLSIGCTYVPIDSSLPLGRKESILAASLPHLIIVDPTTTEQIGKLDTQLSIPIVDVSKVDSGEEFALSVPSPDTEAFLLFTSGSTGTPKGIVLGESGFVNFAGHMIKDLSLNKEVVLQQSSPGFDMSLAQIYLALLSGSELVIVPQMARGDPAAISRILMEERVTFTCGTPSENLMWLNSSSLQPEHLVWGYACLGGEVVSPQVKNAFASLQEHIPAVIDCYGPTEISCCATTHVVEIQTTPLINSNLPSVGSTVPNKGLVILNEQNELVATGMPGEIGVYGTGLAYRYHERPDLTEQKFTTIAVSSQKAVRVYQTGDRGRLLPNRELVFLGRLDGDTQIKLRGLRVDLEEIEHAIIHESKGTIVEAVVSIFGTNEVIAAHVVPAAGQVLDRGELQRLIQTLPLPQYMIPACAIAVEGLPRTTNGKIDRRLISTFQIPTLYKASSTQDEMTLAEGQLRLLWAGIFGERPEDFKIGCNSDFFDIGGNSHLLAKLQRAINTTYAMNISMRELYQFSTLSKMSSLVHDTQQSLPQISIDWASETKLSADNLSTISSLGGTQKSVKNKPLEVILTGATSFLGASILSQLVSSDAVGQVHCIAVEEKLGNVAVDSQKVVTYNGSLSHPTLGLSRAEQTRFESSVDLIIHAGSYGHCLNNYSSLVAANLNSTKFLSTLGAKAGATFEYLSSNRTIILSGTPSLLPTSVATFEPPKDGSEGLTATKWASERYLENFAKAASARIRIHRACAVTGDLAPSEDATNAILRFSRLLKALPEFTNFEGYFDFADVQQVATEFVEDVLTHHTSEILPSSAVSFKHYSSGIKVAVDEIKGHMEASTGQTFEQVPLIEWIGKAQSVGMDPLIVSYLRALCEKKQAMVMPYMGEV